MSQKRKKKGREQRRRTALTATITSTKAPVPTITSQSITSKATEPVSSTELAADTLLLRRDLTRVAIVVAIVLAVLVLMVATNNTNGWLDRIADELYHWLRLG